MVYRAISLDSVVADVVLSKSVVAVVVVAFVTVADVVVEHSTTNYCPSAVVVQRPSVSIRCCSCSLQTQSFESRH